MEFLFMLDLPTIYFYDGGADTSDLEDRLWDFYLVLLPITLTLGITYSINDRQNKLAAKKNTIDMIERAEHSELLQHNFLLLSDIARSNSFDELVEPSTTEQKVKRNSVFTVLNHYEMVAIGIKNNHFDKGIYRDWMQSTFIRDWIRMQVFVQKLRWVLDDDGRWIYRSSLFSGFNKLAYDWDQSGDVYLLNSKSVGRPSIPLGPGDEPMSEKEI